MLVAVRLGGSIPSTNARLTRLGVSHAGGDLVTDTAIVRVTDDSTPDEIREAITNIARTASRCPAHWIQRRAKMHERINALLDELEARTCACPDYPDCDQA